MARNPPLPDGADLDQSDPRLYRPARVGHAALLLSRRVEGTRNRVEAWGGSHSSGMPARRKPAYNVGSASATNWGFQYQGRNARHCAIEPTRGSSLIASTRLALAS